MPYNQVYLKRYNEKLSEYLAESKKLSNYLPPPDISNYDELVRWFKVIENTLNRKNQSALLRHKRKELYEAYLELQEHSLGLD